MQKTNLQSSVNEMGETVCQIIHFIGGEKRTFHGIITSTIQEGSMAKFLLENGSFVLVNTKNVLCIEVFKEKKEIGIHEWIK